MTAAPVIAAPPPTVRVTLPIRTVNEGNMRSLSHWPRTRRTKQARSLAALVVGQHWCASGLALPVTVTLTRIAPSAGLDDDGVCSALKATRDGVADALGVDDRHPGVTWAYGQRKGQRQGAGALGLVAGFGVEIRIEARAA